ncbi:MAG: hypothetical protein L6R40_002578 [Gallowayella cf. fulva]|nr:MAG: hypothetical protein L6R40_002578 [Xanthomendoza cf. fulva]
MGEARDPELLTDPSYIGSPYFTQSEANQLKSFVPDGSDTTVHLLLESALDEKLKRRQKKREATQDYWVCAAHDLAPVFEKAFGVRSKDLQKDKKFIKSLTSDGLVLKEK